MARGKVKPDEHCKLTALRVRMTYAQRAKLEREAASRNMELSTWTRVKLGLEEGNQAAQPARAGA